MDELSEKGSALRVNRYTQRTSGIKTLLSAGVIVKAKVVDAPESGFTLVFEAVNHEKDIILLHARRSEIKVFKNIETAIQYCRRDLEMRGGIEVLA
jgi:hypothetical protein